MGQVIVVLNAHNVSDSLTLGYLGRRDVAQADVADQSLAPEVGQHRHLLGDRPLFGAVDRPHRAVVDDVECLQAQVAEVVFDTGGQVFGRDGRLPRFVGRAAGAELGDDDQLRRVWVQGLPDDLVSDVRPVEVGGVNMVDAGGDGLAKDGDGTLSVPRRSPHTAAGQLHRAVAYPLDCQRGAGERESAAERGFSVFIHSIDFF